MINGTTEKIKYFLYARKSLESEDRQVQSIEDQISRLKDLAANLGLEIKEILTEAKSAKKPYNRTVFSEMIKRIEKGEAGGILCWQINRLSRNPIDSGTLSWLLQQGVLKCIQTIDRRHLPDDNVLLFNVESSMANQFIIDLRKNCRRGMEGKAERGWLPALPPIGYVNDKADKTIVVDKKRFPLVRRMWDMMLTGNYTVETIRNIANTEWGFRTPRHNSYGDKEISTSLMYKIFSNIFYTGMFEWAGKFYNGKHGPMITLDEYDHVQILLGRKGKPRKQKHEFAYTGLIHCGECGSMYTASEKLKLVKTTGELKTYVYYHCTHKKKGTVCKNAKPLTLGSLEEQIESMLEKYTIMPEFFEWALEVLEIENGKGVQDKTTILDMRQASLLETQKELDNLTRMRYKELVDEETYLKERNSLLSAITKFKQQLEETDDHSERYVELTEKTFHFATYARQGFVAGTLNDKREILSSLGSNYNVKDKILNIEAAEWLIPIEKDYPTLEAEYREIELKKNVSVEERNEVLNSIRQRWCTTVKDVRTVFITRNDPSISIPVLPYDNNNLP
ncbi:MAG TPA: recombinase family protein [Chitinophagales bacterium]|nr:recombinase family protein [Chitinophagales bacterium]